MHKSITLLRSVAVSLSVLFAMSTISSCASMFSSSQYPVTFSSSPSRANIKVYKDHGLLVYEGVTPTTVVLDASSGFFSSAQYKIEYKKAGYRKATSVLSASIDGVYFLNILFGGFLGLIIIDPATGAMWKLSSAHATSLGKKGAMLLKHGGKQVKVGFVDSPDERLFVEAVGEKVDLKPLGIDVTVHQPTQ